MRKFSVIKLSEKRFYYRYFIVFYYVISVFFWGSLPGIVLSQEPVNYKYYTQDPLGGIHVNNPAPFKIEPVAGPTLSSLPQSTADYNNGLPAINGLVSGPPSNVNNEIMSPYAQQTQSDIKEVDQLIDEMNRRALEKERVFGPYRNAFARLSKMNPDSFSLSQAVYEVENAYLENQMTRAGFDRVLQVRVDQVRRILKEQGLSVKNNLSINYAIQQLFEHPTVVHDPKTHVSNTITPFKYDLEDFMGEKDYTKLFASKLLATGSGQCHSLPLVYLMIAERLGAKAWLSLAPEHSFIQFMDSRGRLQDYETTNGNIVSGSWMAGSGFINAKALRNRTYLDTLSQRKLFARCLSDLLLGYLDKCVYDEFAQQLSNKIVQLDPSNMAVLLVDANLKRTLAIKAIKAVGTPKPADLPKYPEAYQRYLAMKDAIDRVENLGFQDMPSDAYQAWLQSIEVEKKKQATEKLQERIRFEARMQKSTLKNIKN